MSRSIVKRVIVAVMVGLWVGSALAFITGPSVAWALASLGWQSAALFAAGVMSNA